MQPASAGAGSMDLAARIFFVAILFNNLAGNAKPGFIPIEKASAFSQSGGMNFFAQPARGAMLQRRTRAGIDEACDARRQALPLLGARPRARRNATPATDTAIPTLHARLDPLPVTPFTRSSTAAAR